MMLTKNEKFKIFFHLLKMFDNLTINLKESKQKTLKIIKFFERTVS